MQAQVVGELGVEAERDNASLPDCDCVSLVLRDHLIAKSLDLFLVGHVAGHRVHIGKLLRKAIGELR